jgi:predicted nucleotidyltransferase
MSLDFSGKSDLLGLARLVRALQAAAHPRGIDFFLMGAAARDLMLRHAHGISAARLTEDADFAVMVRDWSAYEDLRAGLMAGGEFTARPGPATHRLRHRGGSALDIVPFGGVERPDRMLAWPPDGTTVFDCFGMNEALGASVMVRLPESVWLKVAPMPALTVLKACAWQDRKHIHPGQDAPDLLLFLRHYMDCGNFDRALSEHGDLFEADDFDHVEAGVRLLARDIAALIGRSGVERLLGILAPEADEDGALLLARQSGIDLERARRLLEVLCDELAAAA